MRGIGETDLVGVLLAALLWFERLGCLFAFHCAINNY